MNTQSPQLKNQASSKKVDLLSSVGVGARQKVQLHYLRIAPRKVRRVADLIRGMSVNEAEASLMLQSRRSAKPILKLLRSAIAAARANKRLDMDKAYIETITVDQGPMRKWRLPRAQGSASPIQKKMSHITIILSEGNVALPRFTIVVPKKTKAHDENAEKRPKVHAVERAESTQQAKKQHGFFKRVFSRNTGDK